MQPRPVLAESVLDGLQLEVELLDLLLLVVDGQVEDGGGGAREQYGGEQAGDQRHRSAERRAHHERHHPDRDPGARPARELLQPEERSGEGAGQHSEHGDPDGVVVGRRRQRGRLHEHQVPHAGDAESDREPDGQRVAAQLEHASGQHVPTSPRRTTTRNANSHPAWSSTVSAWVSEKAPRASASMADIVNSRASHAVVSLPVIRQCRYMKMAAARVAVPTSRPRERRAVERTSSTGTSVSDASNGASMSTRTRAVPLQFHMPNGMRSAFIRIPPTGPVTSLRSIGAETPEILATTARTLVPKFDEGN